MKLRRMISIGLIASAAALNSFAALSKEFVDFGKGPATHFMTKDELKQWKAIKTDEDAQKFIAVFWARRDPTPATPRNEFKEEFDARVALANKKYPSGKTPGSMTDRGKIFVLFGPPHREVSSGEAPSANIQGGSGTVPSSSPQGEEAPDGRDMRIPTHAFIYEKDRIPAWADQKLMRIEFVDQNRMNTYRIGHSPDTNVNRAIDRAIQASIVNPTITEPPTYAAGAAQQMPASTPPAAMTPAGPPVLTDFQTPELKTAVTNFKTSKTSPYKDVYVTYGEFVTANGDYFVPVQLFVPASSGLTADQSLTFFGVVEDSTGKVVQVFEEPATLRTSGSALYFDRSVTLTSGKYKGIFGLAASGKPVTMTNVDMNLSGVDKAAPRISEAIISEEQIQLTEAPAPNAPFTFGGLKVVPKGDRVFSRSKSSEIFVFFEVMNPALGEDGMPKLQYRVAVNRDGKPAFNPTPIAPLPVAATGVPGRWGYGQGYPASAFKPGAYSMTITVIDPLTLKADGKPTTYARTIDFKVVE